MTKAGFGLISEEHKDLSPLASTEYTLHNYSPYEKSISPEERKLNGIVYTPSKLANYVAAKVVAYFLEDICEASVSKTGIALRSVKPNSWRILDPACGDGELLVAGWLQLLDKLSTYFGTLDTLPTIDPIEILCGIDIDHYAIRRTKSRISELPGMHGVSADLKKFVTTNALLPFYKRTKMNGWKRIFGLFDVQKGFDIVIANPPWGANIDLYKDKLSREEFSLYQGQFDTSDLFIELALSIVKPGGYFAFIIPDSLFNLERTNLRSLLLKETQIRFIGRFGEKIFDKINRACAIIICRKARNSANHHVECLHLTPEVRKKILSGHMSFKKAEDLLGHVVPQQRFHRNQDYLFDIDVRVQEEGTLYRFKRLSSTFRDYLQSNRGIELSKNGRIYRCPICQLWLPLPNAAIPRCRHCQNILSIHSKDIVRITSEKKLDGYQPLIVGESIRRYLVHRNLWIAINKLGIKYKARSIYASPKLLIRKTGVGISAAIDYSGAYTNQVVYIFHHRNGFCEPIPLEFFLGVLNSRAMYYYLVKTHGETEWRSHPYVTQKQILDLPLPDQKILLNSEKGIVRSIVNALKPFMMRGQELPREVDGKVERMVANLYGLRKKDYEVIYGTLDNVQELIPIRALKRITINEIFEK